jgi:hypothetical protein
VALWCDTGADKMHKQPVGHENDQNRHRSTKNPGWLRLYALRHSKEVMFMQTVDDLLQLPKHRTKT